MNNHPNNDTHVALTNLTSAMNWLNSQGYRVSTQDGLYFTNGVEDLELYHDWDDGWYYEVDAP